MRIVEGKGNYFLVLYRGEPLIDSINRFADEHHLSGALLHGVGSLRAIELGYFDMEARAYRRHRLEGEFELLSFEGNVSLKEGKPSTHAHVTLSGPDFSTKGGHLFEAVVAVTAEIAVLPTGKTLERHLDEETGIYLL